MSDGFPREHERKRQEHPEREEGGESGEVSTCGSRGASSAEKCSDVDDAPEDVLPAGAYDPYVQDSGAFAAFGRAMGAITVVYGHDGAGGAEMGAEGE